MLLERYASFRRNISGVLEHRSPVGGRAGDNGEEMDVCPHIGQLVTASELLGIDQEQIEADHGFCGHWIVAVDDIGPLSGRRGKEHYPEMYCCRLASALSATIKNIQLAGQLSLDQLSTEFPEKFKAPDKEFNEWMSHVAGVREGIKATEVLMDRVPTTDTDGTCPRTVEEAVSYLRSVLDAISVKFAEKGT